MSGWFSLEAVYAKKGDALILHYGSRTKPRWMLIDGGHTGVYDAYLRPRLEELGRQFPGRLDSDNRLPLKLVMVSHADADHLEGILDLTEHMRNTDPGVPPAPVSFDTLWFNGFSDLIAEELTPSEASFLDDLAVTASLDGHDIVPIPAEMRRNRDLRAVIASTRQGRQLMADTRGLGIDLNPEFPDQLVTRGGGGPAELTYTSGLKIRILAPDKKRIDKLRKKWKTDLKKILEGSGSSADSASFKDSSPFNLASIIVLAKRGGRTMLLTGDARGDDLILGLEEAGQLTDGKIHVDLFKLPHHGSDRNVKTETFRDITAEHYLISANGEHENPEPATLTMLAEGRAETRTDAYTLHLTFPHEAYKLITEEMANQKVKVRKQKDALEAIDRWLKTEKPPNMDVVYREQTRRSLAVDLDTEQVTV